MSSSSKNSGIMAPLTDAHGRRIEYMRVSLTDRCNYRCVYCMPPEGENFIPHEEILSYEELLRVARLAASLGVGRYKVTGGEPLCRKGAVEFIRQFKMLPGVEQVTLTTNGALLGRYVDALADIGVDGINVSLDSLHPEHFAAITRGGPGGLAEALAAIRRAGERGLRVKLNCVPLHGYNEGDLLPLARFALEEGYHLRFIELMPVGPGRIYAGVRQEAIREAVEAEFGALEPLAERIGNGPAEHFGVAGKSGSVGFISALSKKFCHTCNRVRLTSLGFLKTCLHHNMGEDLKPLLRGTADDEAVIARIFQAVQQKPLAHEFTRPTPENAAQAASHANFCMNSVGG